MWQAASDHHRLITALKKLYPGAWISTGGSKGGMTAVYHRRFYPKDVAGTVAYSAPNNTDDRDDSAYDARLEAIGSPECRAAIKSVQRQALIRREAMTERYGRWAEEEKNTFQTIGSVDRAFELAILHQPSGGCASIPTAAATDDTLYAWAAQVPQLPVYTDQTLEGFSPYFYQLGTQLGYAQLSTPHLDGLLRHPGIQEIRSYVPRDIPLRFQPAAMADIDRWVRHHGSSLMFVNGENDVAVADSSASAGAPTTPTPSTCPMPITTSPSLVCVRPTRNSPPPLGRSDGDGVVVQVAGSCAVLSSQCSPAARPSGASHAGCGVARRRFVYPTGYHHGRSPAVG
ncbi:S28 family serine protease [Streptomyces sp. ISL-98]|uniref:S28 family serine protease n=1 Tax=Streptomyces sp. ISL-98 TaxID=2819192 RepID=UPI0027E586EB|nr:S28 family serine protease [Streptomyces sp. ISL-98]